MKIVQLRQRAFSHEIQDKNTNEILNIDSGSIFYSNITGINKSTNGTPGEKEATYDVSKKFGSIYENTNKGIFGSYTGKIDDSDLYEVADPEDIKTGVAQILTVLDGETISSYTINIESLNTKDENKNIVFSITDKSLLDKTGGIVQGMSGSPILQDGKIIGAVTHVIVNDCTKGYGIFITNMLEEAEN